MTGGSTAAAPSAGGSCRRYTSQTTTKTHPSPTSATGASRSRKARYEMAEKLPISMFWGLPVSVATLPTLAAVASAIRYGTGGRPSRRVRSTTSGAITTQITSFTKSAESVPAATTTAASAPTGVLARRMAHVVTSPKKPESRR